MHLSQFYHAHRAHRLHFTNFWLYELSMWFNALSMSLIWVFVPILMLKTGYSVRDVVVYYLLYNIADVPLNFVARKFIQRFGPRSSIVLATLTILSFFLVFSHLENLDWKLLVTLAFLAALYDALYWVAHIYLFILSNDAAKGAGKNTGVMYAVREFAVMFGPAVGAALLIFFDKSVVLYATGIGLVLSLIPLLGLTKLPDPGRSHVPARKFFSRGGLRPFLSTALYAVHDTAENNIFPIFIYVTFGTLQSVASVPIVFSIAAMAFSLTLGRMHPRRRNIAIIIGALFIAVIWASRLFTTDGAFLYFSVFVVGLFSYLILVPTDSAIFEHGRSIGDPLSAAMYRNVIYMGMNIILFGILLVLLNVFDASFVLAAASLLCLAGVNAVYFLLKPLIAR
jgi:MFS family permease